MLIDWVLEKKIEDKEGFHKPSGLEEGDPRRLSRTIAPMPPPPTADLAVEKLLISLFHTYMGTQDCICGK